MSAILALAVIWTIVAMIFYCCYRLWYWTPMATSEAVEAPEVPTRQERRAA